jgi:hypothetical protein
MWSKKPILCALLSTLAYHTNALSDNTHVFLVTPRASASSPLMKMQTGTAIYQVTNNSKRPLSNIGLINLPSGVSQVTGLNYDYCSSPIALAAGESCLIKLAINSSISGNVHGGPQVCYSASRPSYCSQPFSADQLSIQTTPYSDNCEANIANFNASLALPFGIPPTDGIGWGPSRNHFPLSANHPNLTLCATNTPEGVAWQQKHILAAADYWISQKLNYCEHHTPDFQTPISQRGNPYGAPNGGYCNPVVDLAPDSVYYNQQARWNYSGTGSETLSNWVNNNAMWYGFDCSNYTAFIYDFSLGIQFDAAIQGQSGQTNTSKTQTSPLLGPNNGGAIKYAAGITSGYLVCQDGTSDTATTDCGSPSNPYISTIDATGQYHDHGVTAATLTQALQPGDLIYVAGDLDANTHVPAVTHVIMWTGKTIGTEPSQIHPDQIAPDELCYHQNQWVPIPGQPVITDSHYQGPDYRMLTQCFYIENIWAVRRVITTP